MIEAITTFIDAILKMIAYVRKIQGKGQNKFVKT